MRFTPTLIAAILPALIVLPAQATPATPTETKASAVAHAKPKAQTKASPKAHHKKVHAAKKPQPVAKTAKKPNDDQASQNSDPSNAQSDKASSSAQPSVAQMSSAPSTAAADSQPQAQSIDPKLVAKALALAKAQNPAQDTPDSADMPSAKASPSLLDRAGASFQQVGASLQNTLDDALGLIGIRYRRGGTTPETGFDCSGFVVHVFREGMGLILPRTSRELSKVGEIVKKNDLQPGDLVFFNTMRRTFSHVGIYLGNGQFIHAPRTGSEVRIEDMRESYWVKRYEGARRMEITE